MYLVTGCAHQALSGTKVALAAVKCDQTFHARSWSGWPSPMNRPGTKGDAESRLGCDQMCHTTMWLSGWSGEGYDRKMNVQGTNQCTDGVVVGQQFQALYRL